MDYQLLLDGWPELMALSLWQPWASLIAWGFKRYETRSWSTAYRGPLVIQAAKSKQGLGYHNAAIDWAYNAQNVFPADLPLGAALCVVDLVDCLPTAEVKVSAQERAYGDYGFGRFAWKLENVRVLKQPIPMRGYQQIFNIDQTLRAAIWNEVWR